MYCTQAFDLASKSSCINEPPSGLIQEVLEKLHCEELCVCSSVLRISWLLLQLNIVQSMSEFYLFKREMFSVQISGCNNFGLAWRQRIKFSALIFERGLNINCYNAFCCLKEKAKCLCCNKMRYLTYLGKIRIIYVLG